MVSLCNTQPAGSTRILPAIRSCRRSPSGARIRSTSIPASSRGPRQLETLEPGPNPARRRSELDPFGARAAPAWGAKTRSTRWRRDFGQLSGQGKGAADDAWLEWRAPPACHSLTSRVTRCQHLDSEVLCCAPLRATGALAVLAWHVGHPWGLELLFGPPSTPTGWPLRAVALIPRR
jgi:hypothetical protein